MTILVYHFSKTYENWREMYKNGYGLANELRDYLGTLRCNWWGWDDREVDNLTFNYTYFCEIGDDDEEKRIRALFPPNEIQPGKYYRAGTYGDWDIGEPQA